MVGRLGTYYAGSDSSSPRIPYAKARHPHSPRFHPFFDEQLGKVCLVLVGKQFQSLLVALCVDLGWVGNLTVRLCMERTYLYSEQNAVRRGVINKDKAACLRRFSAGSAQLPMQMSRMHLLRRGQSVGEQERRNVAFLFLAQ